MNETAILYESSTDTLRIKMRPWPEAIEGHDGDRTGGEDAGEIL